MIACIIRQLAGCMGSGGHIAAGKAKMGQVQTNEELCREIRKYSTGRLVKMNQTEKQQLVQSLASKTFTNAKVFPLQDVTETTGFLYKKGCFFYEGTLKDTSMQGQGRLNMMSKQIEYQGQFDQNNFSGAGTWLFRKKCLVAHGQWKEGLKQLDWADGKLPFKMIVDAVMDSNYDRLKVKLFYPDGKQYEGEVLYDAIAQRYVITGQGRLTTKNGNSYTGEFIEGKINGKGGSTSIKGRYEGEFKDGRIQGKGCFYYLDGSQLAIDWLGNRPHGYGWFKEGGEGGKEGEQGEGGKGKDQNKDKSKKTVEVHYQFGQRVIL